MTLLDIKNQLYSYLLTHDSIEIKQFILDNNIIDEDISFFESCLELALDEFVESKILKKASNDTLIKWILTQPINSYSQDITLSSAMCIFISEVLNGLADDLGDKSLACDASKIKENDIKILVGVATEYRKLINQTPSE